MEDLTGKAFGKWTVIERAFDKSKSKGAKWKCRCECGTERIVWGKYLRQGASTSCGCAHIRNWVGERFGNLVITSVERENHKNIYHCICDCGNTVTVYGSSIYGTKSCGCIMRTDRSGERYGSLVIDKMLYNFNSTGTTFVSCTCDCGKSGYVTRLSSLRSGNTRSCGCVHVPDIVGHVFGKLTVIRQVDSDTPQRRWLCACECGQKITALSSNIISGHVKSCGCLRSSQNSTSEVFIRKVLDDSNVPYNTEYSFSDCIGVKGWRLRFDFYLPKHNMTIEYDGRQHFYPVEYWGGEDKLAIQKANDAIKTDYCLKHNILLLRLPYTESQENITKLISIYTNIQESRNDHSLKGND
nr:MAG TPA: restriction enzyme [Caudoviricetes sp.]